MPGDDVCDSVGHGPLSPVVVSILLSDWSEGKYEILRGAVHAKDSTSIFSKFQEMFFFQKSVSANPLPLASA